MGVMLPILLAIAAACAVGYFYIQKTQPVSESANASESSSAPPKASPVEENVAPATATSTVSELSPVRHVATPCPGGNGKVVDTVSSLRVCSATSLTSPKAKSTRRKKSPGIALSCVTSRASMYDCRPVEDSLTMLSDDESKFVDGMRFKTSKTKIMPIVFSGYRPLDLTKMSDYDLKSGLSDEACEQEIPEVEHSILTVFSPVLHCVLYSAKHAFLLSELLQEYEYTDN